MAKPRTEKVNHPYVLLEDLLKHVIQNTYHAQGKETDERLKLALMALFGDWPTPETSQTGKSIPEHIKFEIGQHIRETKATEYAPAIRDFLKKNYPNLAKDRNAEEKNFVESLSDAIRGQSEKYVEQGKERDPVDFLLTQLIASLPVHKYENEFLYIAPEVERKIISEWIDGQKNKESV